MKNTLKWIGTAIVVLPFIHQLFVRDVPAKYMAIWGFLGLVLIYRLWFYKRS